MTGPERSIAYKNALAASVGLILVVGCATHDEPPAACKSASAAAIAASITQGKELPPGSPPVSTFPYTVVVRTTSGVLVESVRVGDVSTTLTNAADSEWTAQLSSSNLEAKRPPGATEAHLAVTAKTVCSDVYSGQLDEAVVPLGPAPGATVTDLQIRVEYASDAGGAGGGTGTAEPCSVPVDQSVAALIRLSADAGSEGVKLTAQASTGSFIGGTDHSVELTLRKGSARAEASAYWLPSAAGQTVVTAFAAGATADPTQILVAAAPAIHGPSVAFERGVAYPATIRTTGRMESCVLEEILPGAVSVEFVKPLLGTLDGTISLVESDDALECGEPQVFQLRITFDATADDGTTGVLRCFDTFGQEGDFSFAVTPADGAGGQGGG